MLYNAQIKNFVTQALQHIKSSSQKQQVQNVTTHPSITILLHNGPLLQAFMCPASARLSNNTHIHVQTLQ